MNIGQLIKIKDSPKIICQKFSLGDSAQELLKPNITAIEFLGNLINQKSHSTAVHFLAHGLPKREAIWWAYLCVNYISQNGDQFEVLETLNAAKQWVMGPNDELRQKSKTLADLLKLETPASWIAQAIFWTEKPQETSPFELYENLTGGAVAAAITLAAVQQKPGDEMPKKMHENYNRFLKQGVHVANGGNGGVET